MNSTPKQSPTSPGIFSLAVMPLQRFMQLESAGGIVLFLASVAAMLLMNSSLHEAYHSFWHREAPLGINQFTLALTVHEWINDGLMVIFFFLIGMEIKREMLEGHLDSSSKMLLPLFAALGGVLAPALIFLAINHDNEEVLHGWAIPTATDIAFALAVISLFGKRVPVALKVLLTAIAVIDDLAAILIIAIGYTSHIAWQALGLAGGAFTFLMLLNVFNVQRLLPYLLAGIGLWLAILHSGVHATIAGVLLGLAIPLRGAKDSLLIRVEHSIQPYVVFLVMPLFALANAGVPLEGVTIDSLSNSLPLGIIAGLVVGKPIGIFFFAFLYIRLGFAKLPEGTNWRQIFAMASIAGIGFTMSLFIGMLAYVDESHLAMMRLSVLGGSVISMLVGGLLMLWALRKSPQIAE